MEKCKGAYDIVIAGAAPAVRAPPFIRTRRARRVLLVEQKSFRAQSYAGASYISPECLKHFHQLGGC